MKIEEIDRNFKTADLGGTAVNFYDAHTAPFEIRGFAWHDPADKTFYRFPPELAESPEINEGARWLAHQTSGGTVRFRTDSPFVAIRADLKYSSDMNHMPRAGSAGFDIYLGRGMRSNHVGTAQPNRDQEKMEQIICQNPCPGKVSDFTLNMPLYGGCANIEIGLAPDAKLLPPTPHKIKQPVFFYGNSITQGGCASRPGNSFTNMLCRALDAPQVNLGFSGSGMGEKIIAERIAEVPASAIVLDYDYNAPTPEHLEATHGPFFNAIRKKQPAVPVVFLTAPNVWSEFPDTEAFKLQIIRREIIRKTYINALTAGDQNVYFVDGADLFGRGDRSACTVDRCHPNDLGFYRMYKTLLPLLRKIVK